MKYWTKQKGSSARECCQKLDEPSPVSQRKSLGYSGLDRSNRLESRRVSFRAEGSDASPDGPPILRTATPLHQPLCFQAVDELGDVRANAMQPVGEAPQRHGLASLNELIHRVELRHRKSDGRERRLQPLMQLLGGAEHGDQRSVIGTGAERNVGRGGHTVHALNYMIVM